MDLSFNHKGIHFEFGIERIMIQKHALADVMIDFVMTDIQDMHHLEVIFKEHVAGLDIADDEKKTFIHADDLIVQMPMQCLKGLDLNIE